MFIERIPDKADPPPDRDPNPGELLAVLLILGLIGGFVLIGVNCGKILNWLQTTNTSATQPTTKPTTQVTTQP